MCSLWLVSTWILVYIDSDEDESEVGPSITTWEEPDAQSTLQMERFRESLKNMFPTRI